MDKLLLDYFVYENYQLYDEIKNNFFIFVSVKHWKFGLDIRKILYNVYKPKTSLYSKWSHEKTPIIISGSQVQFRWTTIFS